MNYLLNSDYECSWASGVAPESFSPEYLEVLGDLWGFLSIEGSQEIRRTLDVVGVLGGLGGSLY